MLIVGISSILQLALDISETEGEGDEVFPGVGALPIGFTDSKKPVVGLLANGGGDKERYEIDL